VWVFNTANQTQGTATRVAQNLFDLTSAAAVASANNVANLNLTVSFRGINVTVKVGDTHSNNGGTVNDLVINQAIKNAINNDVYLSKLLNAQDGPGRTLVVTAKTDGVFSDADISVSVATSGPLTAAQAGAVPAVALITPAQLTALGLAGGSAEADGRFDSAIAEDNRGASIVGDASKQPNKNVIDAGLGNDVVVLSSSADAAEVVNVATVGGTKETDSDVVFNASAGAKITYDQFDTIITSAGVKVAGGVGTVAITVGGLNGSAGNDTIDARAATVAQAIDGKEGNDTIFASAHGDQITGGLGGDKMTGGAGVDTFVIGNLDSGLVIASADEITGFATGSDKLQLGVAGTAGNSNEAGGAVADFTAALAAADTALGGSGVVYAFQWDASNGYLFEDTNADGTADQVIVLVGVTGATFDATTDIIA
jgi:Ca2+-binding RTX toxin-like protein